MLNSTGDESFETLLVERTDAGALWITLNRPERRNALTATMLDELTEVVRELDHGRDAPRVVLFRGAGDHFCAGLDRGTQSIDSGRLYELVAMIHECTQPTVALLHGRVSGFGLALAVAADIRLAAESMSADDIFIRLGVSGCELGISYLLPRQVPASIAAEIVLTGRKWSAQTAARIGWVSNIVPDSELGTEADRLVHDMLRAAPLALRMTKKVLRGDGSATALRAAMALERAAQDECMAGPDFQEAIAAFVERRSPAWVANSPHA